jgi:hypothetical protein
MIECKKCGHLTGDPVNHAKACKGRKGTPIRFRVDGELYETGPAYEFEEPGRDEAEIAAEYFYDHHDGWDGNWPLELTVIGQDGKEVEFTIDIEFAPSFYARENEKDMPHE